MEDPRLAEAAESMRGSMQALSEAEQELEALQAHIN